jgi:hypothetical protein
VSYIVGIVMLNEVVSYSDTEFMSMRKIGKDPLLKSKRNEEYQLRKLLPKDILKKFNRK